MSGGIANVLSIAGSDPSGGAGIQADLKTFAALGCYGMAAITALTAQNTTGVRAVQAVSPDFVAAEIDAIFEDIEVHAVKIGMLGTPAAAEIVAARLARWNARNVVLDPVLAATSGDDLGGGAVADAILAHLLPLARLVTPNLPEIARLTGLPEPRDVDGMRVAGRALISRGAEAVLVKGGHLDGDAVDVLVTKEGAQTFSAPRIATRGAHGTGCTLSSAISALLGQGATLRDAVSGAKAYLGGALGAADRLDVGQGHGPLNHFHALWRG